MPELIQSPSPPARKGPSPPIPEEERGHGTFQLPTLSQVIQATETSVSREPQNSGASEAREGSATVGWEGEAHVLSQMLSLGARFSQGPR